MLWRRGGSCAGVGRPLFAGLEARTVDWVSLTSLDILPFMEDGIAMWTLTGRVVVHA
jgi:hypothetical protein